MTVEGFRRIFSRFEKLDIIFLGFIHLALVWKHSDSYSVNTP